MENKDKKADGPDEVEVVTESRPPPSEEKKIVLVREVFPLQLPIVPLNHRPLFPRMTVPMAIENDKLRKMIVEATKAQTKFIGLVLRRNPPPESDAPTKGADLYQVGVIAEILQVAQVAAEAPLQVLVGAMERFRIVNILQEEPHIIAKIEYMYETQMAANEELGPTLWP